MANNTVKIEQFIFDYFENNYKDSYKNISNFIFAILKDCSFYSENNTFDRKQITLYFTDAQLAILKEKQKNLGYEDNFTRFVRYGLFNEFMQQHNVSIQNEFFGKQINCNKFKLLLERCKDELINGQYTSYDLNLLRDNKEYEGKVALYQFNKALENENYSFDFIECDMLAFLANKFFNGAIYSELVDSSTKQEISNAFLELENDEILEPFIDYDNIVPDTNSFYYLYLYYAFILDPDELDIDTIFDETDEHINSLLEKYTFEKILKYNKQKYNIENINMIFNQECIDYLLANEIMIIEDIESIESTEIYTELMMPNDDESDNDI